MAEKGKPVFLVAERDMSLRRLIMDMLKDLGYDRVLSTASGTMAWTLLKQHGADFIICGLQLNEINGLALLKIIRADETYSDTPFMLVAELVTKGEVVEAGEAGVTEIFCRPLTLDRFKDKLTFLMESTRDMETREVERHYKQGLELMVQEKWQEALLAFRRIITSTKNPEVYYNLGYINTVLERYEEAVTYFRRATVIDQSYAKAFQKMHECYAAMGDRKAAQTCLNRAVEIYMEKERQGVSREEILQEILSTNPKTINIYNTLGIIYRRQGNYRQAAEQYKKALRVNPTDENIYFNFARCILEAGELEQARQFLSKALEMNPDFVDAARLLKIVEDRMADPQAPVPSIEEDV